MGKFFATNQKKIVVTLALLSTFLLGVFIGDLRNINIQGSLFGSEVQDQGYFRYYHMFRETYKILKNEYVDPDKVSAQNLLIGAVKGMLAATEDPYTDYMSPELAKEFAANINASFYGVGIHIEMRDDVLTIVSPMDGTPAARSGVQSGDKIVEIDGISTKGLTPLEAVSKIRGKLGTSVKFMIARPGVLQPFPVVLKRSKITIDTVQSALIPYHKKNIAYIKLMEFGQPTANDFIKALKTMLSENPEGLVIDVRNNSGGLLTAVAEIADTIMKDGLIVYTRGRLNTENHEFRASDRNTILKNPLPIVILANQGSASASEILVGALQDTGLATVVGKTTFGKGCVQKTVPLEDNSLIKYTIAKYYTPAGRSIAQIGIKPDVEADMWFDTLSDNQKNNIIQLQISNVIPDFLQKNNNPSSEDIGKFSESLTKDGYNVDLDILTKLITQRKNIIKPTVYDLSLDAQLNKALEVVISNDPKYKKKIQYFNTPK